MDKMKDLPREGTEERCYDEYEERIDPLSGKIVRYEIEPTKEGSNVNHKTATKEGLQFTKQLHRLNVADYVDKVKTKIVYDETGRRKTIMKAPKTAWIHNLIHLNGEKFDFTGREYLLPIYNTDDKEILLKTARQVEKCCVESTIFTLASGVQIPLSKLRVGDSLVSYTENRKATTDKVKAIESNGITDVFEITTRKHRKIIVNKHHPFLKVDGWAEMKDIKVKDFIALPHKAGVFRDMNVPDEAFLIGALLGDGSMLRDNFGFTQKDGECLDEFLKIANKIETPSKVYKRNNTNQFRYSSVKELATFAKKYCIFNKNSFSKEIPKECFNFDEESTARLIQGLWATDGHCKNVTESKLDIVYSSVSKKMITQIQSLLLKFGIFSSIRENTPTLYKGTDKKAYILRVTGRKSFERFLKDIGPVPGKPFHLPTTAKNSNSHKIPKDIEELIRGVYKSNGVEDKRGTSGSSLLKVGLRNTLEYNPSFSKLERFIEYFSSDSSYGQTLVEGLKTYLDDDVFWDEVVAIKALPKQETFAVETERYHNFITDGIITHNSTLLANELAVMACLIPFFRSMYVSPSHVQTRTFSNDKLKPVLERSPMIARYMQDNKVSTQVFEKGFTNGSMTFLRSAFFSADRARGISSDLLTIDEIQDMIMGNLPVIAQCLSHSKYQYHRYAGTPKSFDNTIEQYWQNTTQNEWMVPCTHCSAETGKKWNFLDIKNVGKHGPICKFCGGRLDISSGQWQSTVQGKRMKGYRIPQLMVPWIREWGGDPWKTLVHEMEIYPEAQFYNEILGLSYDNAAKPITRADVAMNCDSKHHFQDPKGVIPEHISRGIWFGGVDWGEGNDGTGKDIMGKTRNASYTILTIGGFVGKKFKIVYIKKYQGKETDPDYVVKDIYNTCRAFGVRMLGVDWGHGWGVNNQLFRLMGEGKLIQFMYVDNQKEVRKWDPIGYKFQLMRNHVMSETFFQFKNEGWIFPAISEWEWYLQDIMNISVEYTEYQRKLRYIHRPSDPDDCFHSLLYCRQVADIYYGNR